MIMLRTIPRRLKSVFGLSDPWLHRVCRGIVSANSTAENSDSRNHYRHHQSSDHASLRFGNRNTALIAAFILGTTIYHWRHSTFSDCAYVPPKPFVYVDWNPPPGKKRRTLSNVEDKGDSKSVHKSGLSGVELEEVPKAQSVSSPKSLKPSSSSAQTSSSSSKAASKGVSSSKSGEVIDDSLEPETSFVDEKAVGIPREVPYVIVGSGTAAMAAARAIRGSDTSARVLIIGDEPHSPYMRPPLSKELWRRNRERQTTMLSGSGNMKKHSWMFFESDNFFIPVDRLDAARFGGIALWKNKRVVKLNIAERYVEVDSGERVRFDKCLLATGGRPRHLPSLEAASKANSNIAQRVLHFRNIADFEKLRDVASSGGRIVIVGGGFLGSELAVSLAELANKQDPRKLDVVQVLRESDGNMSHVLPTYLADHTMKFMAEKGVKIISSEVTGATWDARQSKVNVTFEKNDAIEADYIVVSVGLEANTQLAADSGLELDSTNGGFLVNSELEARGGIFAAGDACSYYDLLLGRRRVEHINHAEESGRIAGRNMAGERIPYHHQSSFWSTLGRQISWDAVGLIDAKLETMGFFALSADENAKMDYSNPGVVFYLKGGKLVGVLLWNLPDDIYTDEQRFAPSRLNLVRKVLDERRSYSYEELAELARDFDIHETIAEDYEDLKKYMQQRAKEVSSTDKEDEKS